MGLAPGQLLSMGVTTVIEFCTKILTSYSYVVSNSRNLQMLNMMEKMMRVTMDTLPEQCEGL